MSKKVGVIGVGKMGSPMSINLLKAGFTVNVFDIIPENINLALQSGANAADSVCDLVNKSDVIIFSLPNIEVLEKVIKSGNGVISTNIENKVFIDTTTTTMQIAVALSDLLAAKGAYYLDSPVTGGVIGASTARSRFFVGGLSDVLTENIDVFDALGKAFYIGGPGHGQAGKMVCQMVGSANILMAVEATAFALHLGVDAEKVNEVLANNGNGPLHQVLQCIKTRQYNDEGYLTQRSKDIDYCMNEATRTHTFLPLTAAMQQVFNIARMNGFGDMDNEALIALYEQWINK